MRQIPYGYEIENGKAIINETQAEQVRMIYQNYLSGMALTKAASAAGIEIKHAGVSKMLGDHHYLGDDYYPAIIDQQTFERAKEERQNRALKLGRTNRKRKSIAKKVPPTQFTIDVPETIHEDPKLQAEYLYSLIESEVK